MILIFRSVFPLILTSLFFSFSLQGQSKKSTKEIEWTSPVDIGTGDQHLSFKGAGYAVPEHDFPVYKGLSPLSSHYGNIKVTIEVKSTSPLTQKEKQAAKSGYSSHLKDPMGQVVVQQKKPFALVEFVPVFKENGQWKKIESFTLRIEPGKGVVQKQVGRSHNTYASHSVMEQGNWYKLGVGKTGLYKLTYQHLEKLGVDVDSIVPSDINIYGNGFGMLPYKNNEPRPDDLKKNAIHVEGGSDGSLDSNDYLLFFAKSPHKWEFDSPNRRFHHKLHLFSDTAYYFVGIGAGPPKRIQDGNQASGTVDEVVTSFDDHMFHEIQKVNLVKSGRRWNGEEFGLISSRDFNFYFPNIDKSSKVEVKARFVARSVGNSSSFHVDLDGQKNASVVIDAVNGGYLSTQAKIGVINESFIPSDGQLKFGVSFTKGTGEAKGWLDYIEVSARRNLKIHNDQLVFFDTSSVGLGNVSRFEFQNSPQVKEVWDVTDPTNAFKIPFSNSGNGPVIQVNTDSLRKFMAYTGGSFLKPSLMGAVENQDLHGFGQVDMAIVSHERFIQPAERLAEFHREEGMKVEVVTAQQVYNEFSSGIPDITAIKMFMKMFYDRAGSDSTLFPGYLCLFGDGSFINHDHDLTDNTNFIPTYQSRNSRTPTNSYVSDDYFGLLDDGEGEGLGELVDIGIGRLPVTSESSAKALVNKVVNYSQKASGNSGHCSNQGGGAIERGWRNLITFVSDDQNGDGFEGKVHMKQANDLSNYVRNNHQEFDIEKILLDAYQQETTPGGERYPDAEKDLNERVEEGVLIVNYTGHGGENGWAHERLLVTPDIKEWENLDNLPLFVTATCEFSRFDDPDQVSAGEWVLLNKKGGGIGLLTTTRVVYSRPNFTLNINFYDKLFDKEDGEYIRLGEVTRRTKNVSSSLSSNNHRNFTLLGDPALKLALPENKVIPTKINSKSLNSTTDTINALSKVTVEGEVRNSSGVLMEDFSGIVYPKVFDKASQVKTLTNDGGQPFEFDLFKNKLFKGKSSVNKGKFSFSFIVPKDIAYQFGTGRISFYADGENTNANGFTENFVVGGASGNVGADNQGPQLDLYMNDTNFVPGGMTDETPVLLAHVFDRNGVNMVDRGIGHDITAVVDGNTSNKVVLNDHYESDLDTYKSGKVRYQLSKLEEGEHTVKLQVWDVYNNSEEENIDFIVANSEELALDHVLNYPNPFTTHTEFFFEHNQACTFLTVRLRIFTVSGKMVKSFNERVRTDGFRVEPIEWNGRDQFGDPLGRGVYVYKISVSTPDGKKENKFEKLVILN